jgi:hypothetical protein
MIDIDREFIRELLSRTPDPKATLEEQVRFYRCRDMYVAEIEAEVGQALYQEKKPVFSWSDENLGNHGWRQSEEDWIRTGC